MLRRRGRARGTSTPLLLTATTADVGGTVAVTLAGHGRSRKARDGLPVSLSMAGVASPPTVTGDDGRAMARFAANIPGLAGVTRDHQPACPTTGSTSCPRPRFSQASAAGAMCRPPLAPSRAAPPCVDRETLGLTADPAQLLAGASARVVAAIARRWSHGHGNAPWSLRLRGRRAVPGRSVGHRRPAVAGDGRTRCCRPSPRRRWPLPVAGGRRGRTAMPVWSSGEPVHRARADGIGF